MLTVMKFILLFLLTSLYGVHSITIYEARLTGERSGTVQVLTHRCWENLCSSSWGSSESSVLCRQLGYNVTTYNPSTSSSSLSATSIDFSFSCSGSESKLSECVYTFNGEQSSCSYIKTIVCPSSSTCTHGDVRLNGGDTDNDGVAEVCINGFWADICDDGVFDQTVRTFCRQFINGAEAVYSLPTYRSSTQRTNTDNITLYNVTCSGQSGSFIQDCSYDVLSGSSSGGCYLSVGCFVGCTNGDIRLQDGNNTFEGRVELCRQRLWVSVIGHIDFYFNIFNWDYLAARVVCRQLGYPWEWAIPVSYFFGSTSTRHGAVQGVFCDGSESHLINCSISRYEVSGYSLYPSAGVICQGNTSAPTQCKHGDVRLVGGQKQTEGRVEICAYGYWATVCDSSWGTVEADIVCKQLGFPTEGSEYLSGSDFGANYNLPIVKVYCNGYSSSGYSNISQCDIKTDHVCELCDCNHGNEIGIVCQAPTCTHGDVRLFGGDTDHDGVAEVCINGFWADIYDDGVSDDQTIRTFCRQFIGAEAAYTLATYRGCPWWTNTDNITLYNVTCSGQSGSFIQDCSYDILYGSSSGECYLYIGCYEQSNCTNGDIRLSGGNSTFEGSLEVCNQGLWVSVLGEFSYCFFHTIYNWPNSAAKVVCRQLGFPWEWAIPVVGFFDSTSTYQGVEYVYCDGSESHLTNCSYTLISNEYGLDYSYASSSFPPAGVICQGNTSVPTQCKHGDVRLVGGQRTTEGRLEICAYGYWATVCYYNCRCYAGSNRWPWYTVETELVCKQLGFPKEGSEYLSGSDFGANYNLPIVSVCCHSDRYRSSGYSNISQCDIYTDQSSECNCNHGNEIGIVCQGIYFELNGKVYLNNSVLSLTDIGEGESALLCKTDKTDCCGTRPNRFGEFYYPNGVKVPIEKLQETFYRSRGEQHIRLNRREEGNPTTGTYSCEIPNADDVLVEIYITLVQE